MKINKGVNKNQINKCVNIWINKCNNMKIIRGINDSIYNKKIYILLFFSMFVFIY